MRTVLVPPTKTFKDAALAATISIITFIIVYFLLLILALGLTAVLGSIGISVMTFRFSICLLS